MKRVLAFPLVRLALIALPFAAVIAGIEAVQRGRHTTWSTIAVTAAAVLVLFALIVLVEHFTTGRSPAAIGFDPRPTARDALFGFAVGAGLFSAVILELALAGHYRIVAARFTPELAVAALFFLLGAALEELLFRGVLFRLIAEWAGMWVALAVSAVFFGAAHAFNPGASWVSSLAIALEAGVLLGAAFVVTGNLWFPIGLHFAWNFCEGPIYGTAVSGHVFYTSLFTAQLGGPSWLTGGTFGPEAGIPAIVTSLIASCVLLARATQRPRHEVP